MDCPFDLAGKWTYDFGWAYMMIEVKESKVLIYMEYAYGDNGGSDGNEQQ
jgi:hypothetical protein